MGLWSRLRSAVGVRRTPRVHPDDQYGTGLWRQHRDRFNRAVDRFYTTAVALRTEVDGIEARRADSAGDASRGASATGASAVGASATGASAVDGRQTAVADAAEVVAQQTLVLNLLAERFDALAAHAHADCPVDGLVIPSTTRAQLGDLPELMSKAAAKLAEACQAAAMAHVAVRTGTDPGQPSAAARAYIADVAELVARGERLTQNSHEPENG
ncbi:hypothetical protein GCM10022261_20200 [Brevibacterium daeguense]|uniref:Uncharacterized protein n=1 Tax=Brevibacterium daeguense TaxID=909936 RepID=A0ABP8EKM0_9MICO|nr:hypothetical protein [Brevibacterium daeguense]